MTVALILVLPRTASGSSRWRLALVAATAVAALSPQSVPAIGDIAPISGRFPVPHLPDLSLLPGLLLPALSLAIIGLVQGAGISRSVPNGDGRLGDSAAIRRPGRRQRRLRASSAGRRRRLVQATRST